MKSSQDRTPKFYDPQFFSDNQIDGFTHPLCGLGAGDSSLYLNVFSDFSDVQSFEILREEVDWKSMFHKGGEVPRLVAIQGTVSNESYPIYRHPAEKCPDIVPWTKTVCDIKNQLENLTGTIYNHCLIQYYRTSVDYISEHSDKTLDISRNTHVVNYSLGASRVMILKSKKLSDNNNDKEENSKICQKITLPHNSVFFLGWQTNRLFTHEIKQDKRLSNLKRSDELICNADCMDKDPFIKRKKNYTLLSPRLQKIRRMILKYVIMSRIMEFLISLIIILMRIMLLMIITTIKMIMNKIMIIM